MQINLNLSDKWQNLSSIENCYLQGHIFNIGEKKSAIYNAHNIENWADIQNHLNGFYSLVKLKEDTLFAAVDHIRSYPLFYAKSDGNFYLSDNAEWIRKQLDLNVMDEFAKAEFQLTGYVTGDATLYQPIKQLQAGECLLLSDGQVILKRYYTFTHREPTRYDKKLLLEQLNHAAKLSIQNLIDYADGRQIVIPLSGGYDSRLIATLLKEADYDNILTFTYGAQGNREAQYSKIVADSLGLGWHFVEYTTELWQSAWHTDERKEYQLKASNWASLPHLQDWLAVRIMKEKGVVNDDAVFVPGHSGDMVAGSHIPSFIHQKSDKNYGLIHLIEYLFDKHYSLIANNTFQNLDSRFKEKIQQSITCKSTYNSREFANECEKYNWENRQAKFIVNSIQVYDFYDYDWWLPLWDKEFIEFFERLPLALRNHVFYQNYVQSVFLENSHSLNKIKANTSNKFSIIELLTKIKLVRKLKDNPLVKISYLFIKQKRQPNLIEPPYPSKTINKLIRQNMTSNGRVAFFFLKEFE